MKHLHQLLHALGRADSERLALCHQPPGGKFSTRIVPVGRLPHLTTPADRNVWFSTAPLRDGELHGRGTTQDIVGIRSLGADLDVGAGKLSTWSAAWHVIWELSRLIAAQPVAVVYTGGGLQPYWRLEADTDSDIALDWQHGDEHLATASLFMRRWGRLVAHTVREATGDRIDNVYDLTRVMRAPGTHNHKYDPAEVVNTTYPEGATPVDPALVEEILDWYEIPHEDVRHSDTAQSAPETWTYANAECAYVRHMVSGWTHDQPEQRHPWLVSQATRLAAAHRNNCLTETAHTGATLLLEQRFHALLDRPATPAEVENALEWGRQRAAVMTDDEIATDLGRHAHGASEQDLTFDPTGDVAESTTPTEDEPPDEEAQLTGHARLAELFAQQYGKHLRYVHRLGWHVWDRGATAWREDTDGMPTRALHQMLQRQIEYGNKLINQGHDETGNAIIKRAQAACSRNGIEGVLKLAANLHPVSVSPTRLDASEHLLATPNGTLDLHEHTTRPASRDDLLSHSTGGTIDPDDDQQPLRQFLERIQPDPEVRGFLQRLLGSALLGRQREHVLTIWHGTGANGKSALMRAVMAWFGNYATMIGSETLLSQHHGQHPTGLMSLRGARLAFASETDRGRRFNASLVKQLTGGDPITARRMRQDEVTWDPTHTLIMVTNHAPQVDGDDDAMWRRLVVVPFDVTIPEQEQDPDLDAKLRQHLGAIGQWLLEGWQEYQRRGLDIPEAVRARTREHKHESDPLGEFLAERVTEKEHLRVSSTQLFTAWTNWCAARREDPGNMVWFGKSLRKRGFQSVNSQGSTHWKISLESGE